MYGIYKELVHGCRDYSGNFYTTAHECCPKCSITLHRCELLRHTIVYLMLHSTPSETVHHTHQAGLLLFVHWGHEYFILCQTHIKGFFFYDNIL